MRTSCSASVSPSAHSGFGCPRPGFLYKFHEIADLLRRSAMKAFLLACVATIVVAALAVVVLNRVQEPVEQAFATTGVRL